MPLTHGFSQTPSYQMNLFSSNLFSNPSKTYTADGPIFGFLGNPREYNSWIIDHARLFTEDVLHQVDCISDSIQERTGCQVAVVTVSSLPSQISSPKEFATRLFNYWGIGQQDLNNGVLILLVLSSRRLEIEIGKGLHHTLNKNVLQNLQQSHMIPFFKQGNFPIGLLRGMAYLQSIIEEPYLKNRGNNSKTGSTGSNSRAGWYDRQPDNNDQPKSQSKFKSFLLLTLLLGGLGGFVWWLDRKSKPHCCGTIMKKIGHSIDELTKTQKFELELGASSFQKFGCDLCGNTVIYSYPLGDYSECSNCHVRASQTSTRTVIIATELAEGLQEKTLTCRYCYRTKIEKITVPRVVPTPTNSGSSGGSYSSGSSGGSYSSGSSSKSSSFGGGSSSGGGSGSSW
jgi:uncharacterized protein